jgi:phospho-N-acetylmuramoyl-pentapeptide-transferase
MGGVLFLVATAVVGFGALLVPGVEATERAEQVRLLVPILLTTLGFGAIGFTDDYLKVKRGKNLGLKAREKLLGQFFIGIGFVLWLMKTAQPNLTTVLQVSPYLAGNTYFADLGWLYYPLALLFLMGFSNATNITDGLDGLSGGISCIISLTLSALFATSLYPVLGIYTLALGGALMGFLWWNAHPAKVFMGDTGSLAIGAGLASAAIAGKLEIPLIVASLVCWAELFSVIVQVSLFKWRRKRHGLEYAQQHRVFRRSPLHHHFEEVGWAETHIVTRFWLATAVCAALAFLWGR